jgi:hypothetical protein
MQLCGDFWDASSMGRSIYGWRFNWNSQRDRHEQLYYYRHGTVRRKEENRDENQCDSLAYSPFCFSLVRRSGKAQNSVAELRLRARFQSP